MKLSRCLVALIGLTLSGCAVKPLMPEAQSVDIHWGNQPELSSCIKQSDLIGTEGHWYTFWFISNKDLMRGALNDLRNQAYLSGGNTVLLYSPQSFDTSVTILGNSYHCAKP
ncbi:DUF4156 domain-containing protein [Photobacterium minamisatsumaniensis]|uniref:DUF4156 domain-containing protein n=1 Tax=Photobacterium minamisatsumaniensis TaxID=2910233 RepID=UPI003D135BDC